MANKIEELPVFQDALEFSVAVTAILSRHAFGKDRKLWEQINDANDSITANMREGFEQSTDAGFAKFLYHSKGSLAEVLARLQRAHSKKYITAEELKPMVAIGEQLGRMLGGFIRYLARSDFKDRGRHKLNSPKDRGSQSDECSGSDPVEGSG
jgi:four helix bundle protein